jgi:hypothetical protein
MSARFWDLRRGALTTDMGAFLPANCDHCRPNYAVETVSAWPRNRDFLHLILRTTGLHSIRSRVWLIERYQARAAFERRRASLIVSEMAEIAK